MPCTSTDPYFGARLTEAPDLEALRGSTKLVLSPLPCLFPILLLPCGLDGSQVLGTRQPSLRKAPFPPFVGRSSLARSGSSRGRPGSA